MRKFLTNLLSAKSEVSSKRFISILFAFFSIWAGGYCVVHYKEYALTVFGYSLIILGLLVGVFTLPEILSILKPNSKKDD